MDKLKIYNQSVTLVDQVEDKLLNYFKNNDLRTGDPIPNELELAATLGVARVERGTQSSENDGYD